MTQLTTVIAVPSQLVRLSTVDVVIIAFYFALVLSIGWYLKGRANTGEDFFMAGREMTAWVAGLSFLSANLGALELMGWAGSAYQYGILATHWYWIGAIPAMLFLALVMMPFYYISKTHSVPGYLKLRFGESSRALSAISFDFQRSAAILSDLGGRPADSDSWVVRSRRLVEPEAADRAASVRTIRSPVVRIRIIQQQSHGD
jgi:Sodium:solute symporter family